MKRFTLSAILAFLICGTSFGQWVRTNGPNVTVSRTYIASHTFRDMLFAVSSLDTLLRSTDAGLSWRSLGKPFPTHITSFETSGSAIIALTAANELYRSIDSGTSWTAITDGLPSQSILSVKGSDAFLLVGMSGGNIYRSSDLGSTWFAAKKGIPSSNVIGLAITPTRILAFTNLGVFGSSNNGASWDVSQSGLVSESLYSAAAVGDHVWLSTSDGIYRSIDDGQSWRLSTSGPTDRVSEFTTFGAALYAATADEGLFMSSDDGLSWWPRNDGLSTHQLVQLKPASDGAFVLTLTGLLFHFVNTASVSTKVQAGIISLVHAHATVLLPTADGLLAGTDGLGLWLSTNDGVEWNKTTEELDSLAITSLHEHNGFLFLGSLSAFPKGSAGVYRSSDRGRTWIGRDSGFILPGFTDVYDITSQPSVLFAGTYRTDGRGGVYTSTDNGNRWRQALQGGHSYAMISVGSDIFVTDEDYYGVVNKSSDNGTTWTRAAIGLNGAQPICYAWTGTLLFAGTESNGAFETTNGGVTWLVVDGLPKHVESLLTLEGKILAGTDKGTYLSTDNGDTWAEWNAGLAVSIHRLATQGSNVFAATDSGVWRRPLSQLTTGAVAANGVSPSDFTIKPNPMADAATIRFGDAPASGSLRVYNALGKEVRRFELKDQSNFHFNTSDLPSGWYSIAWSDGTRTVTRSVLRLAR